MGSRSMVIAGSRQTEPGGNLARPAGDERHADAAVEGRPFPFAQRAGRAGVVAVEQPRAVVGGEHHQRVVVEAVAFQRRQDLPDRPVDLLDHVAVEAALRLAFEFVGDVQRHVRHVVGHVEKERLVVVSCR